MKQFHTLRDQFKPSTRKCGVWNWTFPSENGAAVHKYVRSFRKHTDVCIIGVVLCTHHDVPEKSEGPGHPPQNPGGGARPYDLSSVSSVPRFMDVSVRSRAAAPGWMCRATKLMALAAAHGRINVPDLRLQILTPRRTDGCRVP